MFNQNKLRLQCCDDCKSSFCEFKQVLNLKKSGLSIYIHEDDLKRKEIRDDKRCRIVLYNAGDKELKRCDYILELCRYKTQCFRCMAIIQRVRNLLEDVTSIRKYELLGICDYCKRRNLRNKCDRCEHIVYKFIKNKVQECKDHEELFMTWFSKIQRVLMSIIQGQVICKHSICSGYDLNIQLDYLLQHLKSSLPLKKPYIVILPDRICLQSSENNIVKSKQIFDELILKLKTRNDVGINVEQGLNNSESDSESSCICQYLNKNKTKVTLTPLLKTLSVTEFTERIPTKSSEKYNINHSNYKPSTLLPIEKEKNKEKKEKSAKNEDKCTTEFHIDKTKKRKEKELIKKQKTGITEEQTDKAKHRKKKLSEKQNKNDIAEGQIGKPQHTHSIAIPKKKEEILKNRDSFHLLLKLMKERVKVNKEKYNKKQENIIKMPTIPDLPITKNKINALDDTSDSLNTIECSDASKKVEIIKGNKIVLDSHYKDSNQENNIKKTPLLFEILANCTTPIMESNKSLLEDKKTSSKQDQDKGNAGVIFYKLSDREFIEKGWTNLPTTKIMRRMNIYKMIPCKSESDWFKSPIEPRILYYESGGKLAEVYENGCGKWFYENGDIALDYHNAPDVISVKRYKLYSSSEDNIVLNKKKLKTVLGCFDSGGNGVVYDHCGNVRLKYNQSEGLVIDKNIGPPGRWKWHTLNEPPVLQKFFLETEVEGDPRLQDYDNQTTVLKEPDEAMITIELENFAKKIANKKLQKYKPFEIRMKALKINDNFSLRIISQSKIYFTFRYGLNYFKQNIGVILKSDEIIDTEIVDLDDVTTPYDCEISKPESIDTLGNNILKAKTKY